MPYADKMLRLRAQLEREQARAFRRAQLERDQAFRRAQLERDQTKAFRRWPLWQMRRAERETPRDAEIRASGPQVPLSCLALEGYARLFAGMECRDGELHRRADIYE